MRLSIMNTKLNENEMPYIIKEKAVNYNFDYKKSANSPKLIVEMMNSLFDLYNKSEEYLYLISMDCVHKPLAFFEISHGAVDRTVASTREIMIKALLSGAVKIVLVHNHPSGDPKPSEGDCKITRKILLAAGILDIRLLDHIIIGKENYLSFREYGLFEAIGGKSYE